MDGERDDVVLTVAVDDDHLAEARIPEACEDIDQIVREDFLGNDDRALLAEMMIGMGAVPDGLRDGAAGGLGNLLTQAGIQIGIFAVGGAGTVVLGGADGDKNNVVLLQAFCNVLVGHVLVIDPVVDLHVAAGGGKLPFAHT